MAAKGGRGEALGWSALAVMLFSPTSTPMRCHRSLSVTPEDCQMNRSTSKLGWSEQGKRDTARLVRGGGRPNVCFALFQDFTGTEPRGQHWAGYCHAV